MMRLGLITEATANARYRALFPMQELERRGHTVVWPPSTGGDAPISALLSCELVHCYRRTDRLRDIRRLSERGVAISFDNDDNFAAAEASPGGGLEGHRFNRAIFRDILSAVGLADLTTTPSELLAQRYRSAGAANVRVIENRLSRKMFGFASRSKHDGIVVGWVAAREHSLDLKQVPVKDALERLLEVHSDLRVLALGVPMQLRTERYEHIDQLPFRDLLTITSRMDIGIAPLVDTLFNRCRSNVKLKEYGSGGAAWLASPVGPYRGLGEKQGGRLVADDRWLAELEEMLSNASTRKRLSKRSLRWAKSETIDRHTQVWESAFEDAIERARHRTTPVRLPMSKR